MTDTLQFTFHYDSINSPVRFRKNRVLASFTFHYDSINSEYTRADICKSIEEFTFHYDSINSHIKIKTELSVQIIYISL